MRQEWATSVTRTMSTTTETKRYLEREELNSMALDEAICGNYDSSSTDGGSSSTLSKNAMMERDRRKKLNEKLFVLRSLVPNITKMDKSSIVEDAIDFIKDLQEQERKMLSEIPADTMKERERDDIMVMRAKRKRIGQSSHEQITPSIEVTDISVCEVRYKTSLVSITCNKKSGTMIKVCQVFESLNLKIITASMTSFPGMLLHTLFIETTDEMDNAGLKEKIEKAIAELDAPPTNPMSYQFTYS